MQKDDEKTQGNDQPSKEDQVNDIDAVTDDTQTENLHPGDDIVPSDEDVVTTDMPPEVETEEHADKKPPEKTGADKDTEKKPADKSDKKDDSTDQDTGEDPAAKQNAKKRSAKERINKAVAKQREAERRELEARRRAEKAESELKEIRKSGKKPSDDNSDDKARPKQEDFETYEEYQEAVVDWKLDQREASKKTGAEDDSDTAEPGEDQSVKTLLSNEQVKQFSTELKKAADNNADFKAKVLDENFPLSAHMYTEIAKSDNGIEILEHLVAHEDVAAAIYALGEDQIAIAREIGKVEALVEPEVETDDDQDDAEVETDDDTKGGEDKTTTGKPSNKTTSKAPKPIKPGSGSDPGNKTPEQESQAEYNARRRREEAEDF